MVLLGDRLQVQQQVHHQVPGEVRTVEALDEPAHLLGALVRGGIGCTDPQPEAVPAGPGEVRAGGLLPVGPPRAGDRPERCVEQVRPWWLPR
ncbi:hypothetical protein [Streptomyces sp. NPDC058304]|uniref:hypothetical protein n=1 Tax=Streptomyces sp. NPDC058304 TaxID=3346437 RepID=UPI0036EBC87D